MGRDNYKFFFGVVGLYVVCELGFLATVLMEWRRGAASWLLRLFALYSLGWLLTLLALLNYHIILINQNLTTNEHVKINAYRYLKNDDDRFDNPFEKGGFVANFVDSMFPSSEQFYFRSEVV